MKSFTINEKKYKPHKMDFNTICELEDLGVSLTDIRNKSMSMARAFFAVSAGLDADEAGREIEKHLINGGTMDELVASMIGAINESDFFQALSKRTKTEDSANPEA